MAADLVITDSAFMVLVWNYLQDDSIRRVSGLEYLSALLKEPAFNEPHNNFWIMANEESAEKNCAWLRTQGINLTAEDVYVAPLYGMAKEVNDPALIEQLNRRRPRHIVATIGGDSERLGLYLRQELDYSPAIHCGTAIAFLSDDQVHIPVWADTMLSRDGCCAASPIHVAIAALLGCAQAPHLNAQTSQQPASFRIEREKLSKRTRAPIGRAFCFDGNPECNHECVFYHLR